MRANGFILALLLTLFFHFPARADGLIDLNQVQVQAAQGIAAAEAKLGTFYFLGEGVRESVAQAVYWWRRAAEAGLAPMQYLSSVVCYFGIGGPRDVTSAYMWALIVPDDGFWVPLWRGFLKLQMNKAQIAQAEQWAKAWQPPPALGEEGD